MAAEFVKQGMKVLLVSRDQQKLLETQKEIGAAGSGEILCVDFNDFGKQRREELRKVLADKDVGVLVNNVGISYDHPEYFHELDEDRVEKLVKLNIDATNYM